MGTAMNKYAILDLETTGLSYENDDIIEISVFSHPNKEFDLHSYAHMSKKIYPDITAINGITTDMVTKAPDINYILNNVYRTFSGHTFVAHNAHNFDAKFLMSKGGLLFYDFKFLDTKSLAKFVLPGFTSPYSMGNLCSLFGIKIVNQHTSVGDTLALSLLFEKLVRLIDSNDTLDRFIKTGSSILKNISKGVTV
jgi:DNA polymerase III epsilon subunit-like protein